MLEGEAKSKVLSSSKHPVFFAELLPILAAFHTWQSSIEGRDVIVFTDNEAARHAYIKGYSPLMMGAEVLACAWLQAASMGAPPGSRVCRRVATRRTGPRGWPHSQTGRSAWQKCHLSLANGRRGKEWG